MRSIPTKIFQVVHLTFLSIFASISVSAQIAIDNTTSTQVTTDGNSNFTINGGNKAGENLFHSFSEFSVLTNGSAYFNNAPDITNIFNRVTGGSISNIDGILKANGNANLFMINPAGIIFGQNARLDIGGSFYGSTANSIVFPDGIEFAADNLQPPVLTINAPIGLNFRDNPGDIVVKGDGNGARLSEEFNDNQDGLQVNYDRTLALIGGNLTLENATLITGGGKVELGSVAGNEQVNLIPLDGNFSLDYQDIESFGDINLSRRTTVNTSSAIGGGEVRLQGKNITLNDRSAILSDTIGNGNGKGIDIKASETFQMANKAFISTSSLDGGKAGNLNIYAHNEIKLTGDGTSNLARFLDDDVIRNPNTDLRQLRAIGGIFAASIRGKKAGSITITTGKLLLQSGFIVLNSTVNNGGTGSDINIQASNFVQLINSGLFSTTIENSAEAGNIEINTNKLRLEGVGGIFTSTFFNSEAGGEININATESVQLFGLTANNSIGSTGIGSISVESGGDAGDINIKTDNLIVRDGAAISVSSISSGINQNKPLRGAAGNINITANFVTLDNKAEISAKTAFGDRGNISFTLKDNLVMRNNSTISAEALENANGGNIDINAQFIIAFPSQNGGNDIIASAQQGEGGKIKITAEALLGIEARKQTSLTNDINASSEFNQDGSISIITPDVDVTRGLTELPKIIIESTTIVSNVCSRGETSANNFTLKGKGGIFPELTAPLTSDAISIEGKYETSKLEQDKPQEFVTLIEPEIPLVIDEIVPARGAILLENGDVILTAYPTTNSAPRTPIGSANCQISPKDT